MDSEEKKDCKYWDKCYQRNELHLEKYNHPLKTVKDPPLPAAQSSESEKKEETKEDDNDTSKKRKSSEDADDSTHLAKKNNTQRLWQQPDEDYTELLKTNKFIHAKFLVNMPKDFYQFWDFYTKLDTDKAETEKHPFLDFSLELVGPFDFLAGKFESVEQKTPGEYLRHWRFFYDPPEFQTIFVKKGTGIHYGYWRDDPKEEENLLIARNDSTQNGIFEFVATNTFDALAHYLEKDFKATPFNRVKLSKLRKAIDEFVSERKVNRNALHLAKNHRWKTIAAKTFHGAGIVVPVDKKSTIGYRPLLESDANLKKIISLLDKPESGENLLDVVMEKLQPTIAASVIALDECDFGSNLELGIDLFISGQDKLHPTVESLLVPAYTLLGRPQFLAILKAHLECRSRSIELSMLN